MSAPTPTQPPTSPGPGPADTTTTASATAAAAAPAQSSHNNTDDIKHALEPTLPASAVEKRNSQSSSSSSRMSLARPSFFSREFALGAVGKDYGDAPLLVCSFVTGLIDAAVFSNWGVFVGMQTGNTVILGLSTAGLPNNPYAWLTTLISIISFLIGVFITFRAVMHFSPKGIYGNRLVISGVFFFQALLVLLAAGLATPSDLIPQNPGGSSRSEREPTWILHDIRIVALIPPLALSSGMQIAASRLLGFNELPVNVLTSTYCDIMGDFKLLALNNVKRNRRVSSVVLLLLGAIVSGWLLRSEGGLESVLYIGGGIKVLIAVTLFTVLPRADAGEKDLLPR